MIATTHLLVYDYDMKQYTIWLEVICYFQGFFLYFLIIFYLINIKWVKFYNRIYNKCLKLHDCGGWL